MSLSRLYLLVSLSLSLSIVPAYAPCINMSSPNRRREIDVTKLYVLSRRTHPSIYLSHTRALTFSFSFSHTYSMMSDYEVEMSTDLNDPAAFHVKFNGPAGST